uniref:Uncharacterized protein n=1 Tax=Alexandrium monilatum TaxID=311494 RepID=A0A7S4SPQ6_9DINO|mmetsp:Transcript_49817/g.156826  ORF Transcript_49817/g.156826 Transcript_49817/m.156826 type:complete len:376 (-) Transcript_49817:120-1247(-)
MSSAPLIPPNESDASAAPVEGQSTMKRVLKVCGLGCGGCFLVVFILAWMLQALMYAWATSLSGCRPGALQGFNYDGDAPKDEDPAYNLMPRVTLLTERSPRKFIMPFYVFPSNQASTIAGGQVGTWWRTWGPIFYTYTYEDMSSKTTIYMRKNLLRLGSSHRIARCDGKEPFVTFTEGSNWFSNRVRTALGYNQAMTFKIYSGDDLVGFAEEATGEVPSLTFRNSKNDFLGTSVLLDPNFHGTKAHWLVKNNRTGPFPYFVPNAASLLYAFHEITLGEAAAAEEDAANPSAAFLAPNVSSQPLAPATLGAEVMQGTAAVPDRASVAAAAQSSAEAAAPAAAQPAPKAAAAADAAAPESAEAEAKKAGEKVELQHV